MDAHNKFEKELVHLLRAGDEKAFRSLYETFAPKLKSFSKRFSFSEQEADDVVQETFKKLWEKRTSLNDELSFNSYVISIAKNLIYNKMRHAAYVKKYQSEWSQIEHDPQNNFANRDFQLEKIIDETVNKLPDKCRYIYKRSRVDGFSNNEIASELKISKSTVENQINKALGKIKLALRYAGYAIPITLILIFQ